MDRDKLRLVETFDQCIRSIEQILRESWAIDNVDNGTLPVDEISLAELISESALTFQQKKTCHQARQLRNFFQHKNGDRFSTPDSDLVQDLVRIKERLKSIPTLSSINWRTDMVTVGPNDEFDKALQLLVHGDFDQLPIFDGDTPIGFFSSSTVSRSVHDGLDAGGAVVQATTVRSLERHWDPYNDHVVDRASKLPNVVNRLYRLSRGRTEALLVRQGTTFCGVLTPFDIGILNEHLDEHMRRQD